MSRRAISTTAVLLLPPVFSEIMKGALQILNVPADENKFQE